MGRIGNRSSKRSKLLPSILNSNQNFSTIGGKATTKLQSRFAGIDDINKSREHPKATVDRYLNQNIEDIQRRVQIKDSYSSSEERHTNNLDSQLGLKLKELGPSLRQDPSIQQLITNSVAGSATLSVSSRQEHSRAIAEAMSRLDTNTSNIIFMSNLNDTGSSRLDNNFSAVSNVWNLKNNHVALNMKNLKKDRTKSSRLLSSVESLDKNMVNSSVSPSVKSIRRFIADKNTISKSLVVDEQSSRQTLITDSSRLI